MRALYKMPIHYSLLHMNVINNPTKSRYELVEDGHTAYADCHLYDRTLSINYVFTPPELQGKGTAGRLMEAIMADVKNQGIKVRPVCGYAASWLKRHPELSDDVV